MKNIYLIVGPSGVGKTTLVEKLAKEHALKQVVSYTTRAPRYPGEENHIFVTNEEFDRLGEMVAYTEYSGARYGVTADIVNSRDLYVIDPAGVEYMLERYKGPKGVVIIWLLADRDEIRRRMKARGDSQEKINERLAFDARAFDRSKVKFKTDLLLHADGIEETAAAVWGYIEYREKYDYDVRIYQINPDHDTERLIFANSEFLKKYHSDSAGHALLNLSIYDEVWAGDMIVKSLDEIFAMFNRDDRPNPTTMRALSVSDIVEISHNPALSLNGSWFCDSFGWKKIDGCILR